MTGRPTFRLPLPPSPASEFHSTPLRWSPEELEASMIDKCFNPVCGEKLLHLRSGRVVRIVRNDGDQFRVEHYWLCGNCYASNDFTFGPHASISLVTKSQKIPVA